jgi:hypothetical protein
MKTNVKKKKKKYKELYLYTHSTHTYTHKYIREREREKNRRKGETHIRSKLLCALFIHLERYIMNIRREAAVLWRL